MKSFMNIPGPKSVPVLGTIWKYIPPFGPYRFDRLDKNGSLKLKQFGPVVREEILPGVNLIYIFDPNDIQELYKKEGRYPERRSHLAVDFLRKSRSHLYNSGGLLPTNGSEWWRVRSLVQKSLSSPRTVKNFLPYTNPVVDNFVKFIRRNRVDEFPKHDLLLDLSRLFLELLGVIAFGFPFNSFSSEELKENSKTSRLLAAAFDANSCIFRLDNGPQLWKYFRTPLYRKFESAHNFMEKVALEMINKVKQDNINAGDSLIKSYLGTEGLDNKDILGTTVDMILAAVDTTTYTSCFALYHLSRNKHQQEKLFNEVSQIGNDVTADSLAACHFLKAVVKETLRMNPVSIGVGRVLQEDAVFSGYVVPKGTIVVTQNQVTCRQPEYFPNPDSFLPERWLQEKKNPYLVLPFGHGPRTCVARRLAEQNIQLLLIKYLSLLSTTGIGQLFFFYTADFVNNNETMGPPVQLKISYGS